MMDSSNIPYNTILQWNCRSLSKRIYTLKHLVNTIKPFIIALQETFIVDDTNLTTLKNVLIFYNNI